jgi:hypothetical protein
MSIRFSSSRLDRSRARQSGQTGVVALFPSPEDAHADRRTDRCAEAGVGTVHGRDPARLATNAAKYGALSVAHRTGSGRVGDAEDGQLVLRWTEAGGPRVNPTTRKGFGSHMIEAMIRGHEGGDVRLNWHPDGLVCEIALPT